MTGGHPSPLPRPNFYFHQEGVSRYPQIVETIHRRKNIHLNQHGKAIVEVVYSIYPFMKLLNHRNDINHLEKENDANKEIAADS